jgi:hypothetical protein
MNEDIDPPPTGRIILKAQKQFICLFDCLKLFQRFLLHQMII